jgi:PAS domain S-box-containing protein
LIFVTANADAATVARTAEAGATGYLVKPFSEAGVRAAIATALASHVRRQKTEERERSLESMLTSLGSAILVADDRGEISFANPRAAELFGWPLHEFNGTKLLDVLRFSVSSDAILVEIALQRAQAAKQREAFPRLEILARDGSEHSVSLDIEPIDAEEDVSGQIVMLRDLNRREPSPGVYSATADTAFGAGTRLLVYSHDTFGLGHLQRSLNLIRRLIAEHPGLSVLLVTGSPMVHRYAMPPGVDYVKLPAVRKVAAEVYEARSLSIPDSGILRLRTNLLTRTVRDYDPNVLLVDHSPTGMGNELLPSIEWLRERGGCVAILGLRDIVDEASYVISHWTTRGVYAVLRELYDHIVIYGSREIFDPIVQYQFPDDIAAKTRFVNYVCGPEDPEAVDGEVVGDPGDSPIVAVSIGGGDGADSVIASFLEMLTRYPNEFDFRAEILTGAFLSPDSRARFERQARGLPVVLREFIPSTSALIRSADLVISTAGYNTTTDLLSHARRAILIPRVLHRKEQLTRARRLAELGLVTCLHPSEVTPERLRSAVIEARSGPETLARERAKGTVSLDGAERFAEFCRGLRVRSRTNTTDGAME